VNRSPRPGTTILIPTTCETHRQAAIWRALESAAQQPGETRTVVIVNGCRFDRALFQALRARDGVETAYHEVGSLAAARRFARSLVSTEYFTFLDDDDEILPGTLAHRVEKLRTDLRADVVVSNGYMYDGREERLAVASFAGIEADPLLALMKQNWFVSCAGLFRTATVTEEFLDGTTEYGEWTMMTMRLLLARRRFVFLERPTFRKHEETVGAMSKTTVYLEGTLATLQRFLEFDLPPEVRKLVRRKVGAALHTRSDLARAAGRWTEAWAYHLRSLAFPGGWRYLPYGRKLIGWRWITRGTPDRLVS
jgi:glycosyltransferase involved in cell wall biosynthesis